MHAEYVSSIVDDCFAKQYLIYTDVKLHTTYHITFDGDLHDIYTVAVSCYYRDGTPRIASHYIGGLLHNMCGWASVEYYRDGNLRCVGFYMKGLPHPHYNPHMVVFDHDGKIANVVIFANNKYDINMFPDESDLDQFVIQTCRRKNEL